MKIFSKFIDKDLMQIKSETGKLTLFGLAFPLFIEMMGVHLIAQVQTMMSAHFMDGFFVNPMSIVNNIISYLLSLPFIVSTGLNILLSVYIGKGKKDDCKSIIATAIVLDICLSGIIFLSLVPFGEVFLNFMGYDAPEYAQKYAYALDYIRVRAITGFIAHSSTIFLAVMRCYGYTKVGLLTNVVGNLISATLTAILYFVIVPSKENVILSLGFIQGFSSGVCFIMTLIIFIRKKIGVNFHLRMIWVGKLLKLGLPASIASIAYTISNMFTTRISLTFSEQVANARIFVNQVVIYAYLLGQNIGKANSIMIGRECGMGNLDRADKIQRQNYRIVAFANFCTSFLLFVLSYWIYKYGYNVDNQTLFAVIIPVMAVDVLVEVGRGLNHIGQNGLNATGDVNFTTTVSIISAFAIAVAGAYLFGVVLGLGLIGMWIAFAIDELTRGVLYMVRWGRGSWRKSFEKNLSS